MLQDHNPFPMAVVTYFVDGAALAGGAVKHYKV